MLRTPILGIIVFWTCAAIAADTAEQLQSQLAADAKTLRVAQMQFRKTLGSIPEYQAAKKQIDAYESDRESAEAAKDSVRIDQAIAAKIKAVKNLDSVAKELEAKDSEVAKITARIAATHRQLEQVESAQRLEQQRKRELQERERKLRAEAYQRIVTIDYSKPYVSPKSVPLVGDESGIAELASDPEKFARKMSILCGAVQIPRNSTASITIGEVDYFVLEIATVTKDAEQTGHKGRLLLDKKKGESVIKLLDEINRHLGNRTRCMRVKVRTIPNSNLDNILCEVFDWQFLGRDEKGNDAWTPWYSEVVGDNQ